MYKRLLMAWKDDSNVVLFVQLIADINGACSRISKIVSTPSSFNALTSNLLPVICLNFIPPLCKTDAPDFSIDKKIPEHHMLRANPSSVLPPEFRK